MRGASCDSISMQEEQILPLQIRLEISHCHEEIHSGSSCVRKCMQATLPRQKRREFHFNPLGNRTISVKEMLVPHDFHYQRLLVSA